MHFVKQRFFNQRYTETEREISFQTQSNRLQGQSFETGERSKVVQHMFLEWANQSNWGKTI